MVQFREVHTLCSVVLWSAVQGNRVMYGVVHCSAVRKIQCFTVQFSTVQYGNTVFYSAVQYRKYSVLQYSAVNCSTGNTVLYGTVQYSAVQEIQCCRDQCSTVQYGQCGVRRGAVHWSSDVTWCTWLWYKCGPIRRITAVHCAVLYSTALQITVL